MRPLPMMVVLLMVGIALSSSPANDELKSLYDAHEWTRLSVAVSERQSSDFYRGVVAEMFNDPTAEALLRTAIRSSSHSNQAYDAYEWLSHLYFRTGQYQRLMATMNQRWTAFPGKKEEHTERSTLAAFQDLPDQTGSATKPATLHHDGTIFIPVSINAHRASYFFDTGAWVSSISESEAKRLGMDIRETQGVIGTALGSGSAGFRMAVANEVTIGDTRFSNVSFAVFPDNQEPWSDLAPGKRGIVGVPLLLGFGSLQWDQDGTVTIGVKPKALNLRQANLYFDNDHLFLTVGFQQQKISVILDTGATTTDLYAPFAKQFATVLEKTGKRVTKEIRGVGHAETFDSLEVPELAFEVGGLKTILHPAHVILKDIGPRGSLGNFGLDLLSQSRAFEIDFGAMTLHLEAHK